MNSKTQTGIASVFPVFVEANRLCWPSCVVLYSEFESRNTEIGAVGPEKNVLRLYQQEVNIFKLARMPLNYIVDLNGRIRYVHFGQNMTDIPDNETFLHVIDTLNASSN